MSTFVRRGLNPTRTRPVRLVGCALFRAFRILIVGVAVALGPAVPPSFLRHEDPTGELADEKVPTP
jgi:hypothetical protein